MSTTPVALRSDPPKSLAMRGDQVRAARILSSKGGGSEVICRCCSNITSDRSIFGPKGAETLDTLHVVIGDESRERQDGHLLTPEVVPQTGHAPRKGPGDEMRPTLLPREAVGRASRRLDRAYDG